MWFFLLYIAITILLKWLFQKEKRDLKKVAYDS